MSILGAVGGLLGGIGGFIAGGPMGAMAGASILGGIGGGLDANAANQANMREANEMSLMSAREQMAFQERMSSTAHQREMADLQKAGLNPILAVNAGSSTPGGASMNAGAAQAQNVMEGAGSTAMGYMAQKNAAMQTQLQTLKQASEIDLLKSQKGKVDMETTVMRKDLPKSEMMDDVFQLYRKAKESVKGNADKLLKVPRPPIFRNLPKQDSVPVPHFRR